VCDTEHATTRQINIWRREAAILLHSPDGDGDPGEPGEDAPAERNLQVHHGPVSLLPREHAEVAELATPQSVLQ